jgi:hypothetical protein
VAKEADINNRGYGDHAKLETRNGKENIGFWTDNRTQIEWPFEVKQAGSFEVVAEVAVGAAQTKFNVSVGSSWLQGTVASTGGYDEFKKVSLGQIEIPQAGTYRLKVRPIRNKWKPINLRSITLEPFAAAPK